MTSLDLGSFSKRLACSLTLAASFKPPAAAASSSVLSGVERQKKYDKREATSYGVSLATAPSSVAVLLPSSQRYKKPGDCTMASTSTRIDSLKSSIMVVRAVLNSAVRRALSSAATGRR